MFDPEGVRRRSLGAETVQELRNRADPEVRRLCREEIAAGEAVIAEEKRKKEEEARVALLKSPSLAPSVFASTASMRMTHIPADEHEEGFIC